MSEYYCPECDQKLYDVEATSYFMPEVVETVWICRNKNCERYEDIVLTEGDLE